MKEQAKKVMLDHLTKKGYPDNMSNEQILAELKPMYLLLEEQQLTGGIDFATFYAIAQQKNFEDTIQRAFGGRG